MASQLRHPKWCDRTKCAAVLEMGRLGGEHLSAIKFPNPEGDDSILIRLWLVGVPETDEGLPTRESTFVNLELTEESVTTTYVMPVAQARALRWNMGHLLLQVTA